MASYNIAAPHYRANENPVFSESSSPASVGVTEILCFDVFIGAAFYFTVYQYRKLGKSIYPSQSPQGKTEVSIQKTEDRSQEAGEG